MKREETDYSYEDLCTECNLHDACHKNGIDYNELDKCNESLNRQIVAKFEKDPEPKEKVLFT